MSLLRSMVLGAAVGCLAVAAGCDQVKEKATKVVREQVYKTVEDTGDAVKERMDESREKATGAATERIKGGEKEDKADAELRGQVKGTSSDDDDK
jgi:hypothetical protein